MKPRVFISSTYYDLKHIRNNLENFIKHFGFEPVLFESGNVTFSHEKKLDESCYDEVKLCQMMILIIGGRYGSPASEEHDKMADYEKTYISITKKEFKTAIDSNIPVYIFIEKNVDSEFQTFKRNKTFFLSAIETDKTFGFAHVDNVNIFNFIEEVRHKAIHTFENFEDIENYLRSQWSGMFYIYLSELKEKIKEKSILNSVSELKNISIQMNQMLTEVGKKIIDTDEYDRIIENQRLSMVKYFSQNVINSLELKLNIDIIFALEEDLVKVEQSLEVIIEYYLLNEQLFSELEKSDIFYTFFNERERIIKDLNNKLNNIVTNDNRPVLVIKNIKNIDDIIGAFNYEIKPLIKTDKKYKSELADQLLKSLTSHAFDLM